MSRVHSGHRQYKRSSARNFTQKEAQLRLEETVKPFNQQVLNALFVNAVEIDYYQAMVKTGKPCTCEMIEKSPSFDTDITTDNSGTSMAPIIPIRDDVTAGVELRMQDTDLFGDSNAEKLYGATSIDVTGDNFVSSSLDDTPNSHVDMEGINDNDSEYEEGTMFGSGANCGICYRTGHQPGYIAYSKQRYVLTTWDIESLESYHINTSDTPNTFKRQGNVDDEVFVEFVVNVPKYYSSCKFSIRNNNDILSDKPIVDGMPINKNIVDRYRGNPMYILIQAEKFTHVVIEFEVGVEKIRANIEGGGTSLDYSKFEAISNYNVVLPPTIHEVRVGDIIVVPSRKLVLKIQERERKITADKRLLEWSATTRLVQKVEALRTIGTNFKLL